jgi:hypothetical protein
MNLRLYCAVMLAVAACIVSSAVIAQPACFKDFKHWQVAPDIENFSWDNTCGAAFKIHYTLKSKQMQPSGAIVEKTSTGQFFGSKCSPGFTQWFTGEYSGFEFEPVQGNVLASCVSKEDAKKRGADPNEKGSTQPETPAGKTPLEIAKQKAAAAQSKQGEFDIQLEKAAKEQTAKIADTRRQQQDADEARKRREMDQRASQNAADARQADAELERKRVERDLSAASSSICVTPESTTWQGCSRVCDMYNNAYDGTYHENGLEYFGPVHQRCNRLCKESNLPVCFSVDPQYRSSYLNWLRNYGNGSFYRLVTSPN